MNGIIRFTKGDRTWFFLSMELGGLLLLAVGKWTHPETG